jgi:hypothetical protein
MDSSLGVNQLEPSFKTKHLREASEVGDREESGREVRVRREPGPMEKCLVMQR